MTDNHLDELLIEAQQKVVEAVGEWVRKQVMGIQVYNDIDKIRCEEAIVTEAFTKLLSNFEISYLVKNLDKTKPFYYTVEFEKLDSNSFSMLPDNKPVSYCFILNFNFTKFSQYELQKNIEFANSVFTWIKTHEHPDINPF